MNLQKNICKRVRPGLGTFLEISLTESSGAHEKITSAFALAGDLEKILSFHDPESELSRYNRSPGFKPGHHLQTVLEFADFVSACSDGAFTMDRGRTDLGGIAKGYIVDRLTEHLIQAEPSGQILVNAGGDFRFFNWPDKKTTLRCGRSRIGLQIKKEAMASSSFTGPVSSAPSSAFYSKKTGHTGATISVISDTCMTADALTKVGLFADCETVQKCARIFKSDFLFFDEWGNLAQQYGSDETH